MNGEFELLPLAAEMEEERGFARMGGGRGMARSGSFGRPPSPPRGTGHSRPRGYPPPRWPRGPYWGPFYGGLPYGVMVSEPYYPALPLPDEPDDDGTQEIPPEITDVLAAMTDAGKPAFTYMDKLMRAPAKMRYGEPGYYLIAFPSGKRWRAYSGHTNDLKRRIQEHILELTRLGLRPPRHEVYVSKSDLSDAQRRAIERRFHETMIRDHFGVLTNDRAELEL